MHKAWRNDWWWWTFLPNTIIEWLVKQSKGESVDPLFWVLFSLYLFWAFPPLLEHPEEDIWTGGLASWSRSCMGHVAVELARAMVVVGRWCHPPRTNSEVENGLREKIGAGEGNKKGGREKEKKKGGGRWSEEDTFMKGVLELRERLLQRKGKWHEEAMSWRGDSTGMVSVSWISLLPYRFVYDFWGLLSFCLFILMFEYEHWGFYYVLVESELVCLHSMFGF